MTLIANVHITHVLMLLFALASTFMALPEGKGRVIRQRRLPAAALLGAMAAIALIVYPTWGELKNAGLWMFAILACAAGVARGYWIRVDIDHRWGLIRLRNAVDGPLAAAGLVLLAVIEIVLANIGPADQPTMELGMTVLAAFLVGRAGAVLMRSRHEPQADLHDKL